MDIKIPTKLEVAALNKAECKITDEYIKMQAYYRFFVSAFLEEKLGLSRLDQRMKAAGFTEVKEEDKNFYQKYESSEMKYLYLRSYVHVERLSQKEQEILYAMNQGYKEKEIQNMISLIENTWKKVLQLDPEYPEIFIEEYPSIDGSGIYKGDTILLGMSSTFLYDQSGNIVDKKKEDKRIRETWSVAKQLEKIATKVLQTNIKVVVEV